MTKGLWVCCPSPMLSKKQYFPILLHSFLPALFLEQSPPFLPYLPVCHFFFFIKSPQPRSHKSYLRSKTFLNIRAVPSSAVFCSNTVLVTTPSSIHFLSFFDVLPSALTTTGMTLMLLIFTFFSFLSLVLGISQFFPSLFH